MEETKTTEEKRIRICIKQNFKNEKGGEYTVRGNDEQEVKELLEKARAMFQAEITQ